MRENSFNKNGITLIALVITIIVLLILAGITIATLTGENGLFARAKQSKLEYEVSAAKEKLELAITDLRIEKVSEGEDLKKEHLPELNSEDIQIGSIEAFPIEAICDKYRFEIDENFAVKYVGEVDGTVISYATEPKGYTNQDKIKISINVVNPKGIKTIEKPNGEKISGEGQTEIRFDYEVTANGTYTFKVIDNTNKEVIKDIVVNKIDRLAPLDFTPTIENITKTGFTIVANASDAEADSVNVKSGIAKYEYYIKESTAKDYIKYESSDEKYSISNLAKGIEYDIYVIAYDKANNNRQSINIKCKTKDNVLDYPILTKNGIVNSIDDNGKYYKDMSVDCKTSDSLKNLAYDTDDNTYAMYDTYSNIPEINKNGYYFKFLVDESMWGETYRIKYNIYIGSIGYPRQLGIYYMDESNKIIGTYNSATVNSGTIQDVVTTVPQNTKSIMVYSDLRMLAVYEISAKSYATLTPNGVKIPIGGVLGDGLNVEAYDNDYKTYVNCDTDNSYLNKLMIDPECWGKYITLYTHTADGSGYGCMAFFSSETDNPNNIISSDYLYNLSGDKTAGRKTAKSVKIPYNTKMISLYDGTFSVVPYHVYEVKCTDVDLSGTGF